jgi:3-isopropylmalate dehydrogenase
VIKAEILEGVDLVFVRELTGGIYFGKKRRVGDRSRQRLCTYSVPRIERITRVAGASRARAPQAHRVDRQVERARDLAPVARGGERVVRERIPRRARSSTCWSTPPRCT